MMNAYDQAHELARALKTSEEYRTYLESRKKLDEDSKNKQMLNDLRRLQWELETNKALGKDVDEAKQKQAEQLIQLVNLNPALRDYLGAEYRFAQQMADVQKILADALHEWFSAAGDIFEKMEQ